ncbi:unnamed protein product [Closterium sp. Yama58-4]|nr:unnamed protein product [Closterium sp. Yama58-4]
MRVQRSASFAGGSAVAATLHGSAVAATLAQQLGWEHEAEAAEEEEERKAREQVRRGREVAQQGEGQQSAQSELTARLEEAMLRANIASAAPDATTAGRTAHAESVDCVDWANRCDVETASSSSSSSDDSSERGDANNADGLDDAIQGTVHHCSFPSMDASDAAQPVLESFCSDISATSAATSSSAFSSRSGASSHWTDIPSSGSLSTPACHVSQQSHPINHDSSRKGRSTGYLSDSALIPRAPSAKPAVPEKSPEAAPEMSGIAGVRESMSRGREGLGGRRSALEPLCGNQMQGAGGVVGEEARGAGNKGQENQDQERKRQDGKGHGVVGGVVAQEREEAGEGKEDARCPVLVGRFPVHRPRQRAGVGGTMGGSVGGWSGGSGRRLSVLNKTRDPQRVRRMESESESARDRERDLGRVRSEGSGIGSERGMCAPAVCLLADGGSEREGGESARDREWGFVVRATAVGEKGREREDAAESAEELSVEGEDEEGSERNDGREGDAGEGVSERRSSEARSEGRAQETSSKEGERGREAQGSREGEGGREVESGAEGGADLLPCVRQQSLPLSRSCSSLVPSRRYFSDGGEEARRDGRRGVTAIPVMPQRAAMGGEAAVQGGVGWADARLGTSSSGGTGGAARVPVASPSPGVRRSFSFTHGAGHAAAGAAAVQAVGGGRGQAGDEVAGIGGMGAAGVWEGPWRKLQWREVEQATDGFATRSHMHKEGMHKEGMHKEGMHKEGMHLCQACTLTVAPPAQVSHYPPALFFPSTIRTGNLLRTCGGYSRVYQGRLPGGQQIAVRREMITCASTAHAAHAAHGGCGGAGGVIAAYGARQGGSPRDGMPLAAERGLSSEVAAELAVLATLSHRHVAQLVGVCAESREEVALVFEHMDGGSLESALRGDSGAPAAGNPGPLTWSMRPMVARQLALALHYLHEGAPRAVVHRNVRAASVMLTRGGEVKLSEFGLALFAAPKDAPMQVPLAGTFGYLAPEYLSHGAVSTRTDVFAFGVVLLELLSGQPPVDDSRPRGMQCLVQWPYHTPTPLHSSCFASPHITPPHLATYLISFVACASPLPTTPPSPLILTLPTLLPPTYLISSPPASLPTSRPPTCLPTGTAAHRGRHGHSLRREGCTKWWTPPCRAGTTCTSSRCSLFCSHHCSAPPRPPCQARPLIEAGRLHQMADPALQGRYHPHQFALLARTALLCTHKDPLLRPSMLQVLSVFLCTWNYLILSFPLLLPPVIWIKGFNLLLSHSN